MTTIRVSGLSTTYRLVSKLYRILAACLPKMLPELTPAERTVVLGLMAAVQGFLEKSPFPGDDDDPGTPA